MKSKERLRLTEEAKIKRQKEKKEAEEAKTAAQEAKKARKAARGASEDLDPSMSGINPERLAQIQPAKHISNSQKRKQEMYAPKTVPPKPIIPHGITLPEGEEDMIALWDITDEEIIKRLNEVKKQKGQERAAFKKQQQKEKVFRRAMKVKKKQAINRGEDFDPEKAAKEILDEQAARSKSKSKVVGDESDSSSDSSSDSNSDSSNESEVEEVEPNTKAAEDSKAKRKTGSKAADGDLGTSGEPKPKKSKRSKDSSKAIDTEEATEDGEFSKKKKKNKEHISPSTSALHPTPEAIKKIVQKEKVRVKQNKKRLEKLAKVDEAYDALQSKTKKRKRSKEEDYTGDGAETKPEKPRKKKSKAKEAVEAPREPTPAAVEESTGGEQWNADALTGDEARKAKFLRLLGAGKSNGSVSSSRHKFHTDVAAIQKTQSELERQYDAGMKLKHDGGSKRRGIGA